MCLTAEFAKKECKQKNSIRKNDTKKQMLHKCTLEWRFTHFVSLCQTKFFSFLMQTLKIKKKVCSFFLPCVFCSKWLAFVHNAPESNKNVMVARVLTQQMIWVIRAVFILIYRLLIVGSSGTSKITILVKFNKNLAIRGDPLIRRNYAIYSISTFPTSSILSCVNKSSQNIRQKLRQTISKKRKIYAD